MSSLDVTSTPSVLQPISNEDAYSSYFTEIANELPHSASQFGLVVISALENQRTGSTYTSTHYRSKPLPVVNDGQTHYTKIDVTIAGPVTTFSARCEPLLMRAAALADPESNCATDTLRELSANELVDRATSENFTKVLKHLDDPVVQGHARNFVSVVPSIIEHVLNERARNGQEVTNVGCFCINDIWKDSMASLAVDQLQIWNRAVKFVISEEDLLKGEPEILSKCQQLEKEQGLVLGPMNEGDIKLMIKSNKVPYGEEYAKWIIKRSLCFRNKEGEMVAWAGTHGDLSIAALHVLPEYRKAGLGKLVLNSLALIHMRLARDIVASHGSNTIPTSSLFAHADCLEDNLPTMDFMERCGWRRVGNYLWFAMPCKDVKAVAI
ncbi:hypothetical protein BGZ49_007885 [Haplosporangium sp. Z 27]|nr:hypothetical protein BGZ49_007885 [Haplosporangium sp. Z 27]